MTPNPDALTLLLRQKKFEEAHILAKKQIEETPDDLKTLLVLAFASPSALEKARWAYKARQIAPQDAPAQKAWASLPAITLEDLIARAGQVNWRIRRINLPIAQATAEEKITLKDLSWASYHMTRDRLLRWAASVYGASLQGKFTEAMTAAEAFATVWPFKQIHLPIEQALRENKIDFGDLCYAILNGRDRLPAAAAIVSALLIFDELPAPASPPAPQPANSVRSAAPASAPAPQPPQSAPTQPPAYEQPAQKAAAAGSGSTQNAPNTSKPQNRPAPNPRHRKPSPSARPSEGAISKTQAQSQTGNQPVKSTPASKPGRLNIVQGSQYLKKQYLQNLEKKNRRGRIGRGLALGLTAIGLLATVGKYWFVVSCVFTALMLVGVVGVLPYQKASRELANYRKGLLGERQALRTLYDLLDERWTLFTNVDLPDKHGDIDGVLVGPSGLYVLEIKAFSGKFRNRGLTWEYRDRFGKWRQASKNPSKQARANAQRLHDFLKQQAELDQWVEPRVVWVGDFLELEKPAVPVWLPNQSEWIQQDLQKGRALSSEQLRLLRSILKTYTAGYRHPGT